LSAGVVLLGVISGLITSMLTPFLPVIIKNSGFSITSVGVLMAVITLVWVIVSPFISGEKIHHRKVLLFTGSQILTGVVVLLLMVKFPPLVVIAILVLRSVFLSVSVITEQLIQLEMFPANVVGLFFGLSQSAFFVGDALGGSVGGWLYSYHMNVAILVCGGLTLLNALLVPLLFAIVKAKEKHRLVHDQSFHKNV
jgi:MFS family permease